jgi:non-specific serine/threonine protein kinase
MAVVYLAEDLRLGRKVALKILALELAEDDRFRERFLRESRTAASIDHPNVIPIFDAGEVDGLLYIAMRHVEDPDLRRLLRAEAPLEIQRTVAIAIQVAGALGAAHQRGLVHRDVKPANILLIHRTSPRAADHAYLSDFGIAKHASSVSGLTATGQLVGTVSYIAPEQIEGRELDGRTDIYSLGCVLFECLAGRPAFRKDADVAVLMAHINEDAPAVTSWRPDCPTDLATIVAKTLEKSPDDRFQTCEELIEALRGIDMTLPEVAATRTGGSAEREAVAPEAVAPEPEPVAAAPVAPEPVVAEPPPPAAPPPRRRIDARWVLGGLLALAVVALALVLLAGGDDNEPARGAATVGTAPDTLTGNPPNVQEKWRVVHPAGIARQQVGAAAVRGRVCIVGGLTGEGNASTATNAVEAYDPAINIWTPTTDLPLALHHPMAVSYRNEFVVIGGFIPEGANLTAKVSEDVYRLQDDKWIKLPPLRHARAAGAAAVVDDKIVVVGGQANGEVVNETEVFDGKRWREGAPMPTPREHLAAAASRRFLYAVGGRELSADTNTGALERYDTKTDTWKKLAAMPTPSGSLGAAVVNGQLVAVGGEAPTAVIAQVQSYNLTRQRWARLAPLPTPRHGLGVVAVGHTLYAVGGAKAPGHAESTDETDALDFGDVG